LKRRAARFLAGFVGLGKRKIGNNGISLLASHESGMIRAHMETPGLFSSPARVAPEQPGLRHLSAACSYIELGMFDEAYAAVKEIDPLCRALSEVLSSRVAIYRSLEKWGVMAIVTKKLAEWNPGEPGHFINLAYATRRNESIQAAHAILKRAEVLHPNDPTIQFDLACYEAQLGNLAQAKVHLARATRLNPKFRLIALDNADLEPIGDSLAAG
jgi:tetratricopeptide (TPR) repeat protein